MKNRCVRFGSSLLLSAMIAVGPAAQAADQGVIHLAAAIGDEAPPTKPKTQAAPKQPTKSTAPAKTAPATTQPPVAATKPATTPRAGAYRDGHLNQGLDRRGGGRCAGFESRWVVEDLPPHPISRAVWSCLPQRELTFVTALMRGRCQISVVDLIFRKLMVAPTGHTCLQ
jgi:hypothetical protein